MSTETEEDDVEVIVIAFDDDGNEIEEEDDDAHLSKDADGVVDLTFQEKDFRRISYDNNDRFAIYKLMAHFREGIVREGRMFCAGAGALGNEVLKNLALLGIGEVWFCDFDGIDKSNLAKSVLFRPADIGRQKVEVAAERLRDMSPETKWVPLTADIRYDIGFGVFRRMDVMMSVVDSIDARVGFNRICAALGKPWLDAGIGELSWRVSCWDSDGGPCYECTMDQTMRQRQHLPYAPTCAPLAEAIRDMNRQPTSPLAAAMSGAMMAQEALKLLHQNKMEEPPEQLEMPNGHQFYFGGGSPYLEVQTRRQLPDCPGHDFWGPVHEETDFTAEGTTLRELLLKGAEMLGVSEKQVAIPLGFDLIYELYCHQCKTRSQRFTPRRVRNLDLSCPHCENDEARPEYKRALRIFEKFADLTLAEIGFPKLHIFQVHGGGNRIAIELTGDEEEVMGG